MFEHLDDPNPPPPRQLLVELVVAEGARRRRRRAVVAGGMAAMLLVLAGGVRLAQAAGSGGDPDVDTIAPADTSPDSGREGPGSGDEISTQPAPGDSTTAPAGGEASTPLGATTFAAITKDGRVVLGDSENGGAIVSELVDAADHDMELGDQVALSLDQQTVYFEATPSTGDEAGESAIYKISTGGAEEPELVGTGTSPAVSPAGSTPRLAYVKSEAHIVVGSQTFRGTGSNEFAIHDLAFTADGRGLVFTAVPPDGPALLRHLALDSLATVNSTDDAPEVGPGEGAPAGTGWSSPDLRATDGRIVAISTCCAPNISGETSLAAIDPNRNEQPISETIEGASGIGIVLQSSYDSSGQNQLVLVVDGETNDLYLRQDGPLQPLDQAEQYTAIDW